MAFKKPDKNDARPTFEKLIGKKLIKTVLTAKIDALDRPSIIRAIISELVPKISRMLRETLVNKKNMAAKDNSFFTFFCTIPTA